jgi:hypothetical protein
MQLDSWGRCCSCALIPAECVCKKPVASPPPAALPHQPRPVAPQSAPASRRTAADPKTIPADSRIRRYIERHGNGGDVSLRSLKRATGATEDDIQALVRRGELALRQDRRKGLGKTWIRLVARVSSWQ